MIPNLILRRFTVGSYGINGYLVADPETRIGVFIDPGGFSREIEAFIQEREIKLTYLFFTHGHWDHTEGLPEFNRHYQVETYAGQGEVRYSNHLLRGGEMIEVGHLRFKSLSIPGHTPHGISYYGHGCLFTGDALFCGSVGGTSSQKEAQKQVEHIHKHLFTLPDETLVFPAHGPMTTVGVERYANPFC
ncbi:MAG: MBL fold metallo-hydrolase [Candidatus Scalindua sp. AMX11]|nr:MAG: MBL fold metallo-hydrolase [Candidatus Scalindua sp.]TDE63915.1 MAG: MBL fold metallo-hydrolase [Candidatus Scalindua sp. AMX11]GJQ60695.1 MAG: MBL fold hydrolase [Candidatus Scalindua sp.]